jgi:hypothetical protein
MDKVVSPFKKLSYVSDYTIHFDGHDHAHRHDVQHQCVENPNVALRLVQRHAVFLLYVVHDDDDDTQLDERSPLISQTYSSSGADVVHDDDDDTQSDERSPLISQTYSSSGADVVHDDDDDTQLDEYSPPGLVMCLNLPVVQTGNTKVANYTTDPKTQGRGYGRKAGFRNRLFDG